MIYRAYIGISHRGTLVGVHPTIPWLILGVSFFKGNKQPSNLDGMILPFFFLRSKLSKLFVIFHLLRVFKNMLQVKCLMPSGPGSIVLEQRIFEVAECWMAKNSLMTSFQKSGSESGMMRYLKLVCAGYGECIKFRCGYQMSTRLNISAPKNVYT